MTKINDYDQLIEFIKINCIKNKVKYEDLAKNLGYLRFSSLKNGTEKSFLRLKKIIDFLEYDILLVKKRGDKHKEDID
jgi:hypothetical protein